MSKEPEFIDGYQIPKFTPTGRGILVPSMDHIMITEDDIENEELLETERELTAKDFETTVLTVGPDVSPMIKPGSKIQIVPHEGQWFTILKIDGVQYFLIKENLVAGVFE